MKKAETNSSSLCRDVKGAVLWANSCSPVTGESVPAAKTVRSAVYAANIDGNGLLRVRITKTMADNTIARIIHLVEEAQASKALTVRFIDRVAPSSRDRA